MTSFTATSLRLIRRLLGTAQPVEAPLSGRPSVSDGLTAVAITESRASDTVFLGATYPATGAAHAWRQQQELEESNALRDRLAGREAPSPRGAFAAALGASLTGQRATVFLSGPDLAGATDLLAQAVGRHAPLIIHLAARASAGHAQAVGSGHEAYHAAAASGCLLLFAINVQEAVDLALIARRVAEQALVPAVICMDVEQTALAIQEVRLPEAELVRQFLGEPSMTIDTPTDAQRMILGSTRRRVPRLFDLERPLLHGPLQGTEAWGLGAAGQHPYFQRHLPAFLDDACQAFGELTGRSYGSVLTEGTPGAEIILVAQGAAVETAAAVAAHVRQHDRRKVGVIGVRRLRPRPDRELAGALKGASVVAIMERTATASDEGPLQRELQGVLARARSSARFGETTDRACPPIPDRDLPRLVSVPYGLGGRALQAADLAALIKQLEPSSPSPIYLGLPFAQAASAFPKQQALSDALRRRDPALATAGLVSAEPPPDVRPGEALTLAIHRVGDQYAALAGEAVVLLHEVLAGFVRTRPARSGPAMEQPDVDIVTRADAPLRDPGDDVPVELAVAAADDLLLVPNLTDRLVSNGAVVVFDSHSDPELVASLPPAVRSALGSGQQELFVVPRPSVDEEPAALRLEALLGGMMAVVCRRRGKAAPSMARLRAAREATLAGLPETELSRHLAVFTRAFEGARLVPVEAEGVAVPAARATEPRRPGIVRRLGQSDQTTFSLARFWDHVGVFYEAGRTDELIAEPGLCIGAMPPLTGALHDASSTAEPLPALDPERCDGDPRLWMACPDGSVAPLVIGIRTLIDAAITLGAADGRPVDVLHGVAGKLATQARKIIAASDRRGTTAGQLLGQAMDAVREKLDADDSRREALAVAIAHVDEVIGDLPLVRTRPFFDDAEKESRGSGELFSLVVNPDACRSAALILAIGADRGWRAVPRTRENIEAARRLWSIWEQLPDTSGATLERAGQHPAIGPLAATMLSRHCSQAAAGGDGAEPGSGAKLALRRVLAVAESVYQPRLQKLLEEVTELRERLGSEIREVLAEGLPTADLDALAEGLEVLGRTDVDLGSLSSRIGSIVAGGHIDGARLARLVAVARGLADLEWHLQRGPTGLGRSRLSVVIAPGTVVSWAARFPFHLFQNPVVVDASGEPFGLARGVLEGQLRRAAAGLRIVRLARRELERSADGDSQESGGLLYENLTEAERRSSPPVLVVGDDTTLEGQGLSHLVWLLGSGLPVKVLILSELGGPGRIATSADACSTYPGSRRSDLALLALAARDAFVVQTSLAHEDHFARGVGDAMRFDGAALVIVHAPSPQRHGFRLETLLDQARRAVDTRAMPLLIFDPGREGVFGSRLDLSGNPEPTATWTADEAGHVRTPVDWAATEGRFAEHLEPLRDEHPGPTPIADYLALTPTERPGRTPYVEAGTGEQVRPLRVKPPLVEDAANRLAIWRTLQELAGVVTPFTQQVREAAQQATSESHRAEVARVRAEYEAQIAQLRETFMAEATDRVTDGLLALAAYGASDTDDGDGGP